MSHRTVRYLPDGVPIHATPADIVACWRAQLGRIPPQFALGTAEHEVTSSAQGYALNEVDTEPPDEGGRVYVSKGLYQLGDIEAACVGHAGADLLTLEGASLVFARLQEERLVILLDAAHLIAPTPDIWPFLAVAHNQGLGAARQSITFHGANWSAYTTRNIAAAEAAVAATTPELLAHAEAKLEWWLGVKRYGDDVVSGGSRWAEVAP